MCCLFGMVDYGHVLPQKRKHQILTVLAAECEARGTDATGIAYNSCGSLHIYKKPVPAHRLGMKRKIAYFERQPDTVSHSFSKLASYLKDSNDAYFESLINQIGFIVLPKKLKSHASKNDG